MSIVGKRLGGSRCHLVWRQAPRQHCVRWGPSDPQKRRQPPIFSPCLLWQNGWCIRIPLGTEVGLSPGDIVIDGAQLLPRLKGHSPPPNFGPSPCPLWPNGWMDWDVTWYGGKPRPRLLCVRRGPAHPKKRLSPPHNFRPMSIVAKRLDGWRCHLLRE